MVASAVAFTSGLLPLPAPSYQTNAKSANITTCKDVEFIFASGSGRELGGKDNNSWESALKSELSSLNISYNFYELGTSEYDGASYPAVGIGVSSFDRIKNSLSATLSKLNVGSFIESVNEGATEMAGRVKAVSKVCPDTKFVIGGYSQGAMVIDRAIPKISSDKLIFAATFGDPNLYLPEGEGTNPPACRGENFSNWRFYAPDCTAHAGFLGANKNYEPTGYEGKVGLWCTKYDIFCSNRIKLSNLAEDHASYAEWGIHRDAAKVIIAKVKSALKLDGSTTAISPYSVAKRDTVILLDTTESMGGYIERYKSEALRLAKLTLEKGGRVALFEFRDELDTTAQLFSPHLLVDFGGSYEDIKNAIQNIQADGGGDIPESALSASLYAMNTLKWQKGATKSIIILTDAGYHNPDVNGITLHDVVKRSLEIDPINFYVVHVDTSTASDYAELVERTDGAIYQLSSNDEQLTETLLLRPNITFPYEEYIALLNEDITFTLDISSESSNIIEYQWDLDLDGIYETSTSSPEVTVSYQDSTEGFVRARVITDESIISSASAKLSILESMTAETPATVEITSEKLENGTLNLAFTTSANTAAALVVADNQIISLTETNEFILEDVPSADFEISLVPVSTSGLRGNPAKLSIINGEKTAIIDGKGNAATQTTPITPSATSPSIKSTSVPETHQTSVLLAPLSGKQ